jgi:RNA polymerase sigma-70 factor (ECF subfamily)
LEEEALGEIFDTYYPILYRYIYYHTHHQQTAEDLTAEVFTRMLERLADGRGPQRHLRAWLYRVAYNIVVDESRRRIHRDHDPLDEGTAQTGEDVEEQAQAAILRDQARGALQSLTAKQQAVLILKYLEGCENSEVAQIMGLTVGAVKSLQHRGLAAMRRHLERMGAEGAE